MFVFVWCGCLGFCFVLCWWVGWVLFGLGLLFVICLFFDTATGCWVGGCVLVVVWVCLVWFGLGVC